MDQPRLSDLKPAVLLACAAQYRRVAKTATTEALWDALIRLATVSKFVAPAGPRVSTLLERYGHEAGDRVCAIAIELT
jgi:hypothetical protein